MNHHSHSAEPALPSSYVVEQRQQYCLHCGRHHSFTQIYLKTRFAGAGNPHRLQPIPRTLTWNLPIEHRQLQVEHLPFCHECRGNVNLGHLRTPPQAIVEAPTGAFAATHSQATTVKGGYAVTPESPIAHKPKAAKQPKPVYTVDDLL